MNVCPITYEPCGGSDYSPRGLRRFSQRLTTLEHFAYSAQEQRNEATIRAGKISIQGVQPKISVRLDVRNSCFRIVDTGGRYIIKPPHVDYPEFPENEDLCMRLAAAVGITVPLHALIYSKDKSLTYIIKRFDRTGNKGKLATEDFAQLSGLDRDTKYNSSLEKVAVLLSYCSFPKIESVRLFRRCLFNYIIGNEDMHLKNYSLITEGDKTHLAPAYDFLSTTTALAQMGKSLDEIEESALPIAGKKRKLTRTLWIDYFASERLGLNQATIDSELNRFSLAASEWEGLIDHSFLTKDGKRILRELIESRKTVLKIS